MSFLLLMLLPINFGYWAFAAILLVNGIGMGLFASPNRADIMNSLPADSRGAGAGMTATFQNAAMVLSIGFFFSLMIAGLSQHLPAVMEAGLTRPRRPRRGGLADRRAAAGGGAVRRVPRLQPDPAAARPGLSIAAAGPGLVPDRPQLLPAADLRPVRRRLTAAFRFAIACVVAAIASLVRRRKAKPTGEHESVGGELAAVAGESGGPSELVSPVSERRR